MQQRGRTWIELGSQLPGSVRVRIQGLPEPPYTWALVTWPCGCRAEGPTVNDLLVVGPCTLHRSVRVVEAPAGEDLLAALQPA